MPLLWVKSGDGVHEIPFKEGKSVREILEEGCIHLRAGCGGMGSCGLCLVRIESGSANAPTDPELRRLRPEELNTGVRFACQARPLGDIRMAILHPPPHTIWRPLSGGELASFHPHPGAQQKIDSGTRFGVAVDLGTTHIRLTLWDMVKRIRIAGRIGLNPQAAFGGDVMTRLTAACSSPQQARDIALQARGAIGEALAHMAGENGIPSAEIGRIVIVGNSAMLTLLCERNQDLLLNPSSWTREIDCRPEETDSWAVSWGIAPHADVELAQPMGGFVGSDLLAGVLATGMTEGPPGTLLIDFGTNSEIALWDGTTIFVTSAAGGPAFEGCGISCGMPAEPGAIYQIEQGDNSSGLRCETLGGGEPLGLCGSALVDAIACLRKSGRLNQAGRFVRESDRDGAVIMEGMKPLRLTQRDIDTFQRAKAAIEAGTRSLIEMAGIRTGDLQRTIVCGAFGRYFRIENAQKIGLLPQVPKESVDLCSNSALAGCEALLFSSFVESPLDELRKKGRIINLAQTLEFEELFIECLYLREQCHVQALP